MEPQASQPTESEAPPRHGAARRLWNVFVHNRVRISFFVFAGLAFFDFVRTYAPPALRSVLEPTGTVGLVLVLAGIAMRSWAAGIVSKNNELATSGPYALTRHPLYAGSFAMGLGIFLIVGDYKYPLAFLALIALIYLPKIRWEEETLARLFGEAWRDYQRETGLFFPRRFPPRLGAPWSFRRWRENREFLASIFGLLVLVVLQGLYAYSVWNGAPGG